MGGLDRAVWIARGWHPGTRRRHWKRARDEVRDRVLDAIDSEGRLPQAHGQQDRTDASALMVPLFGLLRRDDPRAARLIDVTLDDLGVGPHLYRYEPDGTDGFAGREGASSRCHGGRWGPWPSPVGWTRPALARTSCAPACPPS